GSLSASSSDSHATGRPPPRAQSPSSVVLPNPAGAQTSTRPRASPTLSASTSRGRGTNPGWMRGTCSLVASSTSCPDGATRARRAAGGPAIGDLPLTATSNPPSGPRPGPLYDSKPPPPGAAVLMGRRDCPGPG